MQDKDKLTKISDETLLAYLDGQVDPQIVAQIEGSTEYQRRAKELAQLQGQLLSKFYRQLCPDSMELGEFHLGMLSKENSQAVKKHLEECPHCRQELADMQNFLAEDVRAIEEGMVDKIKVLIAQLMSDVTKGLAGRTPAYALRGEEQDVLIYEADKVQVTLDFQAASDDKSYKNIFGLVTGLQSQGYLVTLIRDGKIIKHTQVDEIGNFIISMVSFGEYQLVIRGTGLEIQINDLTIK